MKETSRDRQKAETQSRILDSARALFEEAGYHGTGIREIASRAGVSPGTVLLHFSDKADVLHAALFDDLERVWKAVQSEIPDPDLETCLTSLVARLYDYYASRPKLTRELLRESMFAEEPWKSRFTAQVNEVMGYIINQAATHQAQGKLRPELDPLTLAASCLSFYYFALIGWVQGGLSTPLPFFQQMLSQYLRPLVLENERK
jgi:AcrR family transcriptional regulator